MNPQSKIIVDAAKKLLSEIAGMVNSDYMPGTTSKKIDARVRSYTKDYDVVGFADEDLLKLIALAELELQSVQSKFLNLKGVDPDGMAFQLAFTSVFAKRDVAEEARKLIVERTDLLKKLITHTQGIKALGKTLYAAKLPTTFASSMPAINATAIQKLDKVCDKNIRIYQTMIDRRRALMKALG
jgi:hypothetical protein